MKPTLTTLFALLVVFVGIEGCNGDGESSAPARSRFVMERPQTSDTEAGRVFAVLINGGGSAERNYRSHLQHIRRVRNLLLDGGVPDEHIAIFASDGADPAPDLAIIDRRKEENWWLIEAVPVGREFQPRPQLVDSTVEGVVLQPATRAAIGAWFDSLGEMLTGSDTLLIYVTDHGWKDPVHLNNNAIVLWNERLIVDDLIRLLAPLRERARVVMLMSQCFSGAFARAMRPRVDGGMPDGQVCGYFASTAERFAYGCYAENRGRENVGYSFRLLDAVRRTAELASAHDRVLLTDRTPDVPHKTSDAYLSSLLKVEARDRGQSDEALIDTLLEQAWADDVHYATAFGEIDRIGRAYGSFSPRSLSELADRLVNLPALSRSLRASARQWQQLAHELAVENYASFLDEQADWREVVDLDFLRGLPVDERDNMLGLLIDELHEHARAAGDRWERMRNYRRMEEEARAASYRMQVRLGAALRVRMLLTRIAGRVYLDRYGMEAERAAYERLEACERFELPSRPPRPSGSRSDPPAYPPLAEEMELLSALLPGWLGVDFQSLDSVSRQKFDVGLGAVVVTHVHEFSPAAQAGIRTEDIILGPPGKHFSKRGELREWITTSLVNDLREIELLRDGRSMRVRIRVGTAPDSS